MRRTRWFFVWKKYNIVWFCMSGWGSKLKIKLFFLQYKTLPTISSSNSTSLIISPNLEISSPTKSWLLATVQLLSASSIALPLIYSSRYSFSRCNLLTLDPKIMPSIPLCAFPLLNGICQILLWTVTQIVVKKI